MKQADYLIPQSVKLMKTNVGKLVVNVTYETSSRQYG